MFAQLGNIVFEGLKGFTTYRAKRGLTYAKHALIDNKPRLQRVGEELDELTIDIQFHASFCDPDTEMNALDNARANSEVMPLIMGDGELVGTFVIETIEQETAQTDALGRTILATLSVTLIEYVEPNELGAQDAAFKSAGFGNAANSPIKVAQLPRVQCETSQLMKSVNTVRTQSSGATSFLSKAKAEASKAAHYMSKAQTTLRQMRSTLETYNTQLTNAKNVYNSTIRIKNGIATSQAALDNALTEIQSGNIDGAINANNSLILAVDSTTSASSEIAVLNATRRK